MVVRDSRRLGGSILKTQLKKRVLDPIVGTL